VVAVSLDKAAKEMYATNADKLKTLMNMLEPYLLN
jgi:hypothetical protein